MQFQYNSDYPGLDANGTFTPTAPQNPLEFPSVQPTPCARITTRVYHPKRNQVATVQNVIVRTLPSPPIPRSGSNSSMSSDGFSSTSSESEMIVDSNFSNPIFTSTQIHSATVEDRAYWVQRTIREAIYGRVLLAVVLKKRTPTHAANDNAEWEVTMHHCAVKEMSWQHIRKEKERLAEDPIKEVSAMQYLKRWHKVKHNLSVVDCDVMDSFKATLETNIMMPLDLLSDDRHLYSVMPFCDGGELFERLDLNERFSEEEARYWMFQVLNGIENLQNSGICHRDMSLENLLIHQSGALIIDMGMCLRVPLMIDSSQIPPSTFVDKNINYVASLEFADHKHLRKRSLIAPQGTCGKWIYMSPEVYKNRDAFDGFAVDMWAAGVILFLMLTGFPPWERACQTDERFKYMTAGYLVQMLTEWEIGLSSDAMDLLQRMLWLDPKDRLSLNQVRSHPWMTNGKCQTPII